MKKTLKIQIEQRGNVHPVTLFINDPEKRDDFDYLCKITSDVPDLVKEVMIVGVDAQQATTLAIEYLGMKIKDLGILRDEKGNQVSSLDTLFKIK